MWTEDCREESGAETCTGEPVGNGHQPGEHTARCSAFHIVAWLTCNVVRVKTGRVPTCAWC